MLDAEQIKATIVQRLIVANESCSSTHLMAVDNQLRSLVYVLGDGSPPEFLYRATVSEICEFAGIPTHYNDDGTISWPEDWLIDHGFHVDGDDVEHPILGVGW